MVYLDFTAGNSVYKLRLNTRASVALEKAIGCNPLAIFGDGNTIPTVSTMVHVLHAALQPLEHNITLEKAFDIFDSYIEDGNTPLDFIKVIIELYKVSGIMKEETPKNA